LDDQYLPLAVFGLRRRFVGREGSEFVRIREDV